MDKQKELAQAQTQVQDKSDNEEIQEPEEYEEPEIQEEVKISAKVNVPTIIKNTKIVGKCMQMCPHNEIKYREEHRNLAIFEYDPIGHKAQDRSHINLAKPEWTIKQFVRSAADRKMDNDSEIRPPNILVKTLDYMLNNVVVRYISQTR